MRVFTKLLIAPFSSLRSQGTLSVIYVDDTYLQADSKEKCINNINDTITLLRSLGFTIHADKSVLQPTQKIEFLGFIVNSNEMTIKLSEKKTNAVKNKIESFLLSQKRTIRELASLIGSIVSCFPAEPLGKLHYRSLERFKIKQLGLSKGNYDKKLPPMKWDAQQELNWWLEHIDSSVFRIHSPKVDLVIATDASELGWVATDGKKTNWRKMGN